MSRPQRFAHYIQRLAYVNFFRPDARDERPDDARPEARDVSPHYSSWNATGFSGYVPFRAPTDS